MGRRHSFRNTDAIRLAHSAAETIPRHHSSTLGEGNSGQQDLFCFHYRRVGPWRSGDDHRDLNITSYHWGAIIVGPGYADPIQFKAGNPYGASFMSNNGALKPDEIALAAARFQGRRVAELAAQFTAGREMPSNTNLQTEPI